MNILCITPCEERILIVVRIVEECNLQLVKNILQGYTYTIEGNLSVGICNVVIGQTDKTKEEIQQECSKLYRKLHSYISCEYGEE